MKISFLFFLSLLVTTVCFAQVDISKINEAKGNLERLQKELWALDFNQHREVEQLRKQTVSKGEFETTKQFEEREKKLEEKIWEIESQIRRKTGLLRQILQRQINDILSTEFRGGTTIVLGKYDADYEQFVIYSRDNIIFNYLKVPLSEAKLLKDSFSSCSTDGVSSLLLDEDSAAKEYLLTVNINCLGKVYKLLSYSLSEAKAMQMAYGNFDLDSKRSVWKRYTLETDYNPDFTKSTEKFIFVPTYSSVILFTPFRENGVDKFLLITNQIGINENEENELTCHACPGLPSVTTFMKVNNYWKVETSQKHAGETGSNGSPGEPSLIKIAPEKHAIRFLWADFINSCCTVEREYFWFLDKSGIKEIFSVLTSYDNTEFEQSTKEKTHYTSKVIFLPGNNVDFFDAKVIKTGKRSVKAGRVYTLKAFSETNTYRYTENEYQLMKK